MYNCEVCEAGAKTTCYEQGVKHYDGDVSNSCPQGDLPGVKAKQSTLRIDTIMGYLFFGSFFKGKTVNKYSIKFYKKEYIHYTKPKLLFLDSFFFFVIQTP